MQRIVVTGLALGLLTQCQDYKFEQLCPETITEQEITRAAAEPTPADILFVVDNSGSMADEQENLARNFEFFINQIAGGESDYRMAVVTMDQFNAIEKDGRRVSEFSPGGFRDLIGSSNTCVDTNPAVEESCFRGPVPAERIISTKTTSRDEQIRQFQGNVLVGSCGSGTETGIASSLTALSMSNGCNRDFLRNEANLVIIYVTDEQDGDNTSIAESIAALKAIKPVAQIRLAAIVGFADGEASNCSVNEGATCGTLCDGPAPTRGSGDACNPNMGGRQCNNGETCSRAESACVTAPYAYWVDIPESCGWCSYFNVDDCCSALSGSRYVRFLRNMEMEIAPADSSITVNGCAPSSGNERSACLIDSICQENFGATLERIAKDLIVLTDFNLNPPATNPAGVKARIVGGRFPGGKDLVAGDDYTINDEGTLLQLKGENVPQGEEEKVEVFYVSDVEMPTEMIGACGPQNTP